MTTNPPPYTTAPGLAHIEALAECALTNIPADLAQHLKHVVIQVLDFPDAATEAEMELDSPFDLLGLYSGIGLAHKGVTDAPQEPDMIFLYRRPLLDYWCETGEDLYHLVRHVLIHEAGHHFGFSDADMDAIENLPDQGGDPGP